MYTAFVTTMIVACLVVTPLRAQGDGNPASADPCLSKYEGEGTATREVHVNLAMKAVRIYTRRDDGYTHAEYENVVFGPATRDMARKSGWCHLHPITAKLEGPTPKHGLLNFAVFCGKRQIGFHSDHHLVDGIEVPIPGATSAGCIRIPKKRSKEFFDAIRTGDCVRIYEQKGFWREPAFAKCATSDHCKAD